jgi:hypothetical protein
MEHPIPRETASWFYVFGSAAMTAFALQVVTGPSGQPDQRVIQTAPRPDFFFLWLYALLSQGQRAAEAQ